MRVDGLHCCYKKSVVNCTSYFSERKWTNLYWSAWLSLWLTSDIFMSKMSLYWLSCCSPNSNRVPPGRSSWLNARAFAGLSALNWVTKKCEQYQQKEVDNHWTCWNFQETSPYWNEDTIQSSNRKICGSKLKNFRVLFSADILIKMINILSNEFTCLFLPVLAVILKSLKDCVS